MTKVEIAVAVANLCWIGFIGWAVVDYMTHPMPELVRVAELQYEVNSKDVMLTAYSAGQRFWVRVDWDDKQRSRWVQVSELVYGSLIINSTIESRLLYQYKPLAENPSA